MAKSGKSSHSSGMFVLGRGRFEKISAVEGIRTSREMNRDFSEFDRKALSPKERREALAGKYGAKR
jgi:hypothetical protein